MQTVKIVCLVLAMTALHAKDTKWQNLNSLDVYVASDYRLKKNVKYLEIRAYTKSMKSTEYSTGYKVTARLGEIPLTSFHPQIVNRFKSSSPNLSEQTNIKKHGICIMAGCISHISNGFMVDSHNKIWRMNTVEDLVEMLGKIDTPAETKMILWLHDKSRGTSDKNHKDKYRKTANGYTVISEYDNSISNFGECGHFTYEIKVSKTGMIIEKKLLKKKPSKHGCLAMD